MPSRRCRTGRAPIARRITAWAKLPQIAIVNVVAKWLLSGQVEVDWCIDGGQIDSGYID